MRQEPQTYFALGRPANPRWLVPAGHRWRGDSLLGWRPYRATSRLAWLAMKVAVRCGAAPFLRTKAQPYLEPIADLDWKSLGWCHVSPPEPLVYVGSPGEKRKLVVHLIDTASHSCELVVKVPLTELAKLSIEREALTLLELQHAGFSAAPRLVAFDKATGIASQTVVHGSRAGLKFTREVALLLQALELRGACTSLRRALASLKHDVSQLALDPADAALAARALDEMDDPSQLPAVRIHGDFAPWNIKLQNGSATLVDWEESQPRGLPLHDAYHFVHMTRCLFGKRPRPAWQDLRFRYAVALSSALHWKLELAYLLRSLVREMARPEQRYAAFLLATLRDAIAGRP